MERKVTRTRRSNLETPLARQLERTLAPLARKRGFAEASLLRRWHEVFPAFGGYTRPERLFKGTLSVAVPSHSAKATLEPEKWNIADQMNRFFGYDAVGAVKFVVRQFSPEDVAPPRRLVPGRSAQVRAEARCAEISDEKLKQALIKLGALLEMNNDQP